MRRVRLLLASGAFALLLLGAIEMVVRLSGYAALPAHHSSLRYQALRLPAFERSVDPDGTDFLVPADRRIAWDALSLPKEPGTLRIVICGGSAVAGLGASPNAAFSSYLERMLQESAVDETQRIEVVNLGIVGIASRQVLAQVQDACAHLSPDIVVVYSGNNEFLEIHAAEYDRATQGTLARLPRKLSSLHLLRALGKALRGSREIPPARLTEAADGGETDSNRVSQVRMLREIDMPSERIGETLDAFERNLADMVEATRGAGVKIVLCTVGSNWRWFTEEDLPEGWVADYVGDSELGEDELNARALAMLDRELSATPAPTDHDAYTLLHRRAWLRASVGDMSGARADWRASMNRDPHLRRALDAQNERVQRVAESTGALYFDAVDALVRVSPYGIVGFEVFYDYVHFTALGALTVAGGLAELLQQEGLHHADPADTTQYRELFLDTFIATELAQLGARTQDWLEVDRFFGFAFDPELRRVRDLWKYDKLLVELGRRAQKGPDRALALVYRGNIHALRPDGRDEARADYARALELQPDHPAATANLERVNAAPRPLPQAARATSE